jgi:hypothetical protein
MSAPYEEISDLWNSVWYLFICYLFSHVFNILNWSQESSVGIATEYGLEGRGSIPSSRKRLLSTP